VMIEAPRRWGLGADASQLGGLGERRELPRAQFLCFCGAKKGILGHKMREIGNLVLI